MSVTCEDASREKEITEEEYANISQEEHQRIYKAMEKKDADGARKEMEKHIYRSMKDVLTRYQ